MERYDRQRKVGTSGARLDERLARTTALLIGVGGTGSPLAASLVRAGIGSLILLDPDTVNETDLARQTLYFSDDAARGATKVTRAVEELGRIGGRTRVEGHPLALTPMNAASWIANVDLVLDATDHLPARGWIDDACRAEGVPWIHLAAIEDRWFVIPFLHPSGPCFRCYSPLDTPVSQLGTCETRGVLPAATQLAAAHGAAAFWSWLGGDEGEADHRTIVRGRIGEPGARVSTLPFDPNCPVCGAARRGSDAETGFRVICGKSRLEGWSKIDRGALLDRLETAVDWQLDPDRGSDVVRARSAKERLTVFPDGRVIYGPIDDLERAEARVRALITPDLDPTPRSR